MADAQEEHKQRPEADESNKSKFVLGDKMLKSIAQFGALSGVCYVVSLLLVAIGLIGTAATLGNGLSDGQYVVLEPAANASESKGIFRTYRIVERDYKRWGVDIGAVNFGEADVASADADASVQAGLDGGIETLFAFNATTQNSLQKGTGVSTNEGDVYAYAYAEAAEFENVAGKLAVMVLAFIVLKSFAALDFLQKIAELLLNDSNEDTRVDKTTIKFLEAFKVWRVKDLIISSQFMGPIACAAVGGLVDLGQGLACSWLPNLYIYPLSSIKPDDNFINLASFDFDDDRLFYICGGFTYFALVALVLAVADKAVMCFQRGAAIGGEEGHSYTDYHLETGGCLLERCMQDVHREHANVRQRKRVWALLVFRLILGFLRLSLLACLVAVFACFVYYMQIGFKMVIAFDFSLYGTLSVRYGLVAWACVLRFLLPVIILVDFFLLCAKLAYALHHIVGFLWAYLPCADDDSEPPGRPVSDAVGAGNGGFGG